MPLAQLLAPQIARKAEEIEAALNPQATGYLAQTGDVSARSDARGATRASGPLSESTQGMVAAADGGRTAAAQAKKDQAEVANMTYDPRMASPAMSGLMSINAVQKAGIPGGEAFARGLIRGSNLSVVDNRDPAPKAIGFLRGNGAAPTDAPLAFVGPPSAKMLIPNAAPTPHAQAPQFDKRGRQVVQLGAGPAGATEGGQAVNAKGKKLGYLTGDGDPNLHRGAGNAGPMQAYRFGGAKGVEQLQSEYSKHLKAMRENVNEKGEPTDKFPEGYFKGMSQAEKDKIRVGVEALRLMEKGVAI